MIKRWIVLDIGCIECREPSDIVGLYDTEEEAEAARADAAYAQSLNWSGQHDFQVWDLLDKDPEPERHPEWEACKK